MVNVSWCARWRQSDIKDTRRERREWSLTGSLTEQSVTSSCRRCCKLLPISSGRTQILLTERGKRHITGIIIQSVLCILINDF